MISVDSEKVHGEDGRAHQAIDGNIRTIWHRERLAASPPYPHEIVMGLGNTYVVGGVTYRPRQDGTLDGTVATYRFYVSADGVNWGHAVTSGTFPKNADTKQALFVGKAGPFVRFVAESEVNGHPWASAYMLPQARRLGIGTALVLEALRRVRAQHVMYVELSVLVANRAGWCFGSHRGSRPGACGSPGRWKKREGGSQTSVGLAPGLGRRARLGDGHAGARGRTRGLTVTGPLACVLT